MSIQANRSIRTRLDLRWMLRRDLVEVLAIEHASFAFPWGEEDFIRFLRQRNCIGMVAGYKDHVVGMYVYMYHRDCIELLNFAVQPEFRHRGVGRQMIAKLVGKLSPERRNHIVLCVRETNLPGQLFFRAVGFRAAMVLRGHFQDTGEDAYGMEYFGFGGTL